MIPNTTERTVRSNGVFESAAFGISAKDVAHIMTILRDTQYTDRVLAVIREYSANAWDANRLVGKGDVPIVVRLPTDGDLTFEVSDVGPGLSREEMFREFTQYGFSTKRANNVSVGMLGIGCKSGFAYSDNFTIISRHGSQKDTYVAVIDETNVGRVDLIHSEPCGPETGLTVRIPVRQKDVGEFSTKASQFFRFFDPRPDINVEIPALPKRLAVLKNGQIFEDDSYYAGWTAVMGCVPYKIDLSQFSSSELPRHANDMQGVLNFDIGEVTFDASREELRYDDSNRLAVAGKMFALVDEFVRENLVTINSLKISPWERRLRFVSLRRFRHLLDEKDIKFTDSTVEIKRPELSGIDFFCRRERSRKLHPARSVSVSPRTRFVLKDRKSRASTNGYDLRSSDVVVVPLKDHGLDDAAARSQLDAVLVDSLLDGVEVVQLSTLLWSPIIRSPRKSSDKRVAKFFRWAGRGRLRVPHSDNWEIVERSSSDEDVYVEMESFVPDTRLDLLVPKDRDIAATFGVPNVDNIYGYKVLKREKNPLPRVGTHYDVWRERFLDAVIESQKFKDAFEKYQWFTHELFGDNDWGSDSTISPTELDRIRKELGDSHPVTVLFSSRFDARYDGKRRELAMTKLVVDERPTLLDDSRARALVKGVRELYPLFYEVSLFRLTNENPRRWFDYIKMLDRLAGRS